MTKKISEGELSLTYFNDCKLTLYGADNPDAFRGQYFDGVVMDEYGMMKPSTWSEVILPTLVDRRGWATFIGTPNGPNHFRQLVRSALLDGGGRWFYENHPVSETHLIAEEELSEMKKLMLPEEYAQEMECSFEASARGAFYSVEIMAAESAGRIGNLLVNPGFPIHFIYDLGFRDDTATICFQEALDGYPIIHAEADSLRPIAHYIKRIDEICLQYDCPRGEVWLPHDAKAKTLQTGRSIVEQFLAAGIRPRLVPMLDVIDGIAAARLLFKEIYFREISTRDLVEALKTYRRAWNEDTQSFSNQPIHDWSCFVPGTMIATPNGLQAVESLQVGDLVSTPLGPRSITATYTGRTRELMTIVLKCGATLQCTPNHKLFTQRGLVLAGALRYNDHLFTGSEKEWTWISWILKGVGITGLREGILALGPLEKNVVKGKVTECSIGIFGKRVMALFQKVTKSITKTEIRVITISLIWNSLPFTNIKACTLSHETILRSGGLLPKEEQSWQRSVQELKNSGVQIAKRCCVVLSQELHLPRKLQLSGIKVPLEESGIINKRLHANLQELKLKVAKFAVRSILQRIAEANSATRIVKLRHAAEETVIHDLTVDQDNCYIANGVLSSNSHYADVFRYFAIIAQKERLTAASDSPLPLTANDRLVATEQGKYPFTMNELWEMDHGRTRTGIS
jgi:hypothetical protein